ncbi:MAG: cysteine hydrolase [candidate division WOR-3 bacterium]|jgi:isochorismate hydrolase
MKKQYFTKENLKYKAKGIFQKVKNYRKYHNIEFLPAKSALLVIDMQKYFLSPDSHAYIPSVEAILPGLKKLILLYKERNLPVFFTLHSNNKENAQMMEKWWPKLLSEGSPYSRLPEELESFGGILIEKHQYDAFYDTDLEEILHRENINQLIICGVMTNVCCESTARSAFVRGFEVFFCVDGTATYSEEHHMATLLNLSYACAIPVLLDEIFLKLSKQ